MLTGLIWDNEGIMAASPPLPCDVLRCLGGDVIIVPRGQLTIRLSPDQRRVLRDLLNDPSEPPVTWLDTWPVDNP
jgi:hypothetical protein